MKKYISDKWLNEDYKVLRRELVDLETNLTNIESQINSIDVVIELNYNMLESYTLNDLDFCKKVLTDAKDDIKLCIKKVEKDIKYIMGVVNND